MEVLFEFLSKDLKLKGQHILEAGSGYGRLIYFLNEFDPEQDYTGIDYIKELVDQGNLKFKNNKNIHFRTGNLLNISKKYKKKFDITISYKTLSWLPYYENFLKEFVQVTKKKIYITSLFYDGDIDFVTKVYTDASTNSGDNYSYLNTYSLKRFKLYCKRIGIRRVKAVNLNLDLDISQPASINDLSTYTLKTMDGKRMEITGNTILSWKLLILEL